MLVPLHVGVVYLMSYHFWGCKYSFIIVSFLFVWVCICLGMYVCVRVVYQATTLHIRYNQMMESRTATKMCV